MASPYLMQLRTVQSVSFKVLIEALKELLLDTIIHIDESGLRIVATDEPHQVLVHLKLDAEKFDEFYCPNKISIGVNMTNLHKLIKTINNNDALTLFIEEDDPNRLGIRIENGTARTQFKLNLIDFTDVVITADATEVTTVITMPSCELQKICRDMNNIAKCMEIKNIGNTLIFSCKGDFCSQETILTNNGSGLHKINNTSPDSSQILQGVFNIKQLVIFTKCTNLCNTCEIYLKNDYPLIVKYSVASLGEIKLCLMPNADFSDNPAMSIPSSSPMPGCC